MNLKKPRKKEAHFLAKPFEIDVNTELPKYSSLTSDQLSKRREEALSFLKSMAPEVPVDVS